MRYERTASFKADYLRLKPASRELFKSAVREMNRTAAGAQNPSQIAWPARLRLKAIKAAPGVFEMTWSFSGPDGRATFEFTQIEGGLAVHWRRIGDHGILLDP